MSCKLSTKQRELLTRCAVGEDRQLPEWLDPGPPPFVRPARRWFVPHGLVKPGSIPPSSELPYGQGGYLLTAKGRKFLS